ncbi:metallophosphoesterase [Aurantimonas sp. VKM B-3413]|uniref:metallophosphoesterase n=1 Tax=Aurantimonas sp. VKM B-3413 TaxID=2779401 RepID=UPI001E5B83F5|nr:metallophosphoesterase [Aurantimonas sp. VKM B-3413]MCB8836946.1 metallophosphoesterase [Aurantimonas sp. VKM B-3413]
MAEQPPTKIAAIGDVHGEADLLRSLLDGLAALDPAMPIYFLGDIVDRGAESAQAFDIVAETLSRLPGSRLVLGNHDEWLLRFLSDDLEVDELFSWLGQGGAETLRSYGCDPDSTPATARAHIEATRPGHHKILADAPVLLVAGHFAFVHAGIDPQRAIGEQDRHDCVWIRAPFMNHVGQLSHVIVHGHTPQKKGLPVVTENRVSMDTGAVFTGSLSAVVVDLATDDLAFYRSKKHVPFEPIEPIRHDRGLGTVLDR